MLFFVVLGSKNKAKQSQFRTLKPTNGVGKREKSFLVPTKNGCSKN